MPLNPALVYEESELIKELPSVHEHIKAARLAGAIAHVKTPDSSYYRGEAIAQYLEARFGVKATREATAAEAALPKVATNEAGRLGAAEAAKRQPHPAKASA